MLGHQFAFSAAPLRKVKEVQFGILSPEEIVRGAHPMLRILSDKFFFRVARKLTQSPKLNTLKLWMRQSTNRRWLA